MTATTSAGPAAPAGRTGIAAVLLGRTWRGLALRGVGLVVALTAGVAVLAPYGLALWLEQKGREAGLRLTVPTPTIEGSRFVIEGVTGERLPDAEREGDFEPIADSIRLGRLELRADLWGLALGRVERVDEVTIEGLVVEVGPGRGPTIEARVRRWLDRLSGDGAPRSGRRVKVGAVHVRAAKLLLRPGPAEATGPVDITWSLDVTATDGPLPHAALYAKADSIFTQLRVEVHPAGTAQVGPPASPTPRPATRVTALASIAGLDLRPLAPVLGAKLAGSVTDGSLQLGAEARFSPFDDPAAPFALAWEAEPLLLAEAGEPILEVRTASGTVALPSAGVTIFTAALDGIRTNPYATLWQKGVPLALDDGSLTVSGRVRATEVDRLSRLEIEVADLELRDGNLEQFALRGATASVRLGPRSVLVTQADLDQPRVRIERMADGALRIGGALLPAPADPTAGSEKVVVRLERVRVRGGRVTVYEPERLAQPATLDEIDGLVLGLSTAAGAPTSTISLTSTLEPWVSRLGLVAGLTVDPLAVRVAGGLYGIDPRAEPIASLLQKHAELRWARGKLSLAYGGMFRDGKAVLTPNLLGQTVRLVGRGLGREVPGAGGRTVQDVISQVSDSEGNIDLQIPVEMDIDRYIALEREIVAQEGLRAAVRAERDALTERLSAQTTPEEKQQLEVLSARFAQLRVEIGRRRSEQAKALGGISAGSIVGEALRQTVGGAVSGLVGLFRRPKTLRRMTVPFDAGSLEVPAASRSGLAYVRGALSDTPTACVLIRGSADPEGDSVAGEAALRLAEDRAFAVRVALIAAGADPEKVLLARPFDAESAGGTPLGSVSVTPVR